MKTTGSDKPRRPRRAFTPEFKAEIVEQRRRGDRSIGQVVKDFDLTETAVREWVRQAERDAGTLCVPKSTSVQLAGLGVWLAVIGHDRALCWSASLTLLSPTPSPRCDYCH